MGANSADIILHNESTRSYNIDVFVLGAEIAHLLPAPQDSGLPREIHKVLLHPRFGAQFDYQKVIDPLEQEFEACRSINGYEHVRN